MMCQSEIAPQNMSADVGSVCTLMTDLSAVPRSEFTKLMTSKGVEYLNLDFSLDFIVDSASLMFELKVGGVSFFFYFFLGDEGKGRGADVYRGQVAYGSVTATFH